MVPLTPRFDTLPTRIKIFKNVIQFMKLNQNIQKCFNKNLRRKKKDLIDFGLLCTLLLNSYASFRVF